MYIVCSLYSIMQCCFPSPAVDIVNRTVNKLAHPTAGLSILLNPVNTTDELVDGLQGVTQNSSGCFVGGAGRTIAYHIVHNFRRVTFHIFHGSMLHDL